MEGYLFKKDGFFSGWVRYYFILHEDTLIYLDKEGGKPQGSIHMKISKISGDQKDKLLIMIFNGTNEIYLRANSIKEKVDWTNALVNCQKQCMDGRYDQFKPKKQKSTAQIIVGSPLREKGREQNSDFSNGGMSNEKPSKVGGANWNETLNLAFCSKMFKPDGTFFSRLSQIWELEAQVEELVSLLIPEADKTRNKIIKDYVQKIAQASELIKEKMTECVQELEETRKQMFKVAKTIVQMKDDMINTGKLNVNMQMKGSNMSNMSSPNKQNPNNYSVSINSPIRGLQDQLMQTSTSNLNGPNPQQDYHSSNPNYQQSIFAEDRSNYNGFNQTQNLNGKLAPGQGYSNSYQDNPNYQSSPNLYGGAAAVAGSGQNYQSNELINQDFQNKYQQNMNQRDQIFARASNKIQFDEEEDKFQDSNQQNMIVPIQRSSLDSNNAGLMMGYGGIPISYTMKMRDSLPALIPENQSYSIWAILKSAVGKDLSKVTMPIWLNEPISMLQKISELMHYHNVIEKGMTIQDDCKKLGYIAIFLMTQYSDVYQRNRKPFNPILGETFEMIQPTYRYFSEQVSHHPPISAFYGEGKGYYTYGNTNVKNFFWGGSLEFRAVGLQHMVLTDTNEHIIIKRPDNSANNLVVGKLYVDVHGKMEVTNVTKGIKVVLTIHRQGWTNKNAYKVEGNVIDQNGKAQFAINGLWNEKYSIKDLKTGQEDLVFKADPKPALSERMYGFGYYTINLNFIDEHMRRTLPPTDTRRRMDQRYMEEGDYDKAADEKHRLEEQQRAVRKQRESSQVMYKPAYFKEVDDEHCGEKAYVYIGNYWEKRKNMDYFDCPSLF